MKDKTLELPVEKLRVGLYVDIGLSWTEHPFLFRRFRIKSEEEIEVIRELVRGSVTVYPKKSVLGDAAISATEQDKKDAEDTPDDKEQTRKKLWEAKQARLDEARRFRDERRRVQRQYQEKARQVRQFTNDLSQAPANAIQDAGAIVADMVSHFEQGENVLMNLVNLPEESYSTYAHSLNVTILSLALARSLQITGDELNTIAMSALLHDVGQVTLPRQITTKSTPLRPAEEKVYQTHAVTGGRLARQVGTLPEPVIDTIERHHEMMDGSGYPDGLRADKLGRVTRIVSIANSYDNLCNPRLQQRALTPKQAMAVLYRDYQKKLDTALLAHFIKSMGIYPPGTVVQLSDDSIGLVIRVNPDHLLKPSVLIYNPDIPRNEALMVDLIQREDISVTEALRPDHYPDQLYDYLGIKERVGFFHSRADA